MKHELKIEKQYADAIVSGEKTFEVRFNDRAYQKGDTIKFQSLALGYGWHEIFEREYEITYVLPYYGLKDGFVVLAIRPKFIYPEQKLEEARKL